MLALIILIVTCILLIVSILFIPKIKIGRFQLSLYWVVALLGAVFAVTATQTPLKEIGKAFVTADSINPVKILILFISMTMLSVFLDEVGFFRFLANETLKRANSSQFKLFFLLYLIVSILTVFTSNDVIILSFTPFICYFAKNAKINPIPYLTCEFVAANTWSMALIIGNPTNIYLSTFYGVGFLDYLKIMIVPTLAAGITAFAFLLLTSFRSLKTPISHNIESVQIKDKLLLVIGLIHLIACTLLLALSNYIGLEMYLIAFGSLCSLFICVAVVSIFRRKWSGQMSNTFKRAPWPLIPFVLSMFTMILILNENGITAEFNRLLGEGNGIAYKYGYASFLCANLINNIPMSVLFSTVIQPLSGTNQALALFATVIGSNIGAFLTPVGALAGIMWSSLIGEHDIHFGYVKFLKLGVTVAVPTITVCLLFLNLVIH